MRDPTLPRYGPNPNLRTWGYFVDRDGPIDLVDGRSGHRWQGIDTGTVQYANGSPLNAVEGWYRAPRPWKYDNSGNVLVRGDIVVIDFLDGNPNMPLVSPGSRSTKTKDPDADDAFFPPNPLGQDPNPVRWRYVARNDAGAVTGHVQAKALDGGNKVELVVGGTKFGEGVTVTLDFDAGRITMTAPEVVVNASDKVTLKTGALEVHSAPTPALATAPVVEGLLGFSGLLAGALGDLKARLAALTGPGLNNPAFIVLLQAGAFTSARTKTE